MHNVDRISSGEIAGWVSGGHDGCPSCVRISRFDKEVKVFASRDRTDLLRHGLTRFSGFDLRITTQSDRDVFLVRVESKTYKVTPSALEDANILFVESLTGSHLSGWVKNPDGLKSLCFFSENGLKRAQIFLRRDVNDFLDTPLDRLHGFSVDDLDASKIFAVNINNKYLHWFSSGFFERV